MSSNLQESIVLITSSNPEVSDFGTGFVIYQDECSSYLLTCAHVVSNVGSATIEAERIVATVVASGLEDGVDLAVLQVEGLLDRPPLHLRALGVKGKSFITAGFQRYSKQQFMIRSLHGNLGEQGGVETRKLANRVKSWDLKITDDYPLQPGYSGSPVIDEETGYVVGVVSFRQGEGQKGLAISVEAVEKMRREMLPSVFGIELHQNAGVMTHDAAQIALPKTVPIDLKNTISLTEIERHELVKLLSQCAIMSSLESRDLVVGDLPEAIRNLRQRYIQLPIADVAQIVKACLTFEGGLIKLIEIVKFYENGSIEGKNVDAFAQALFARDAKIRKDEQYQVLGTIISSVSEIDLLETDLERLYRASVPDDYASKWDCPKGNNRVETLSMMLNKLTNELPAEGVIPAIFKFVERIAIRISKICIDLRNWVDITAQDRGISAQETTELRKKVEKELEKEKLSLSNFSASLPPHLLISLTPTGKSKQIKFFVEAWLLYDEEEADCLHASEIDEVYTSKTMPKLLNDLLTKVGSHTKIEAEMKTRLIIEFFLPRELFCQKVEHWLIEEDAVPIGTRNQVVIRSSERIRDKKNRPLWESKWNRVYNPPQLMNAKAIHWIDHLEECDGMKVYANLIDYNVVCLGLTLVPPPILDPSDMKEMFRKMLSTGTPIAVWPRELPENQEKIQEIRQALRSLLSGHRLSDLPDLILKQRRRALQGNDVHHLGHCLALLWEDPKVSPPKYNLEEIEIRR